MCDQSKIFLCVYQKFVKVDFVHEELIENSIIACFLYQTSAQGLS